jgi:hypothetical protein
MNHAVGNKCLLLLLIQQLLPALNVQTMLLNHKKESTIKLKLWCLVKYDMMLVELSSSIRLHKQKQVQNNNKHEH